MQKRLFVALAILVSWLGSLAAGNAQLPPSTRSLYQITSGNYTMVGGIWGTLRQKLPSRDQAFILLTTDPQHGRADLTVLAQDQKTVFLALSNGLISGAVIRFHYQALHPYPDVQTAGTVDYTVTNFVDSFVMEGETDFPPICCDIPYLFRHQDVAAIAMPSPAIRASQVELSPSIYVSEVELSWRSDASRMYQVQYRSDLATNIWTDLGQPTAGSGSTNRLLNRIPAGEPQRFYRVLTVP